MRLTSVPFLCTCIACVYLAGCKDENTEPAAVRSARVVVVTPHQLGVMAEGAGLIQSRYDSPVGFEVGGRLDGDFTQQSDRAEGRGSDANGVPEFDEAAGEERKRLYEETGSPIVSRID